MPGEQQGRKKAARGLLCLHLPQVTPASGGWFFGVAVAESLDATAHVVDRFLGAGIERMRFAGSVQLEQGQLAAIVHLDGFLGVDAGARHEFEAVGQVHEADFAVIRMDAFFHGSPSKNTAGAVPARLTYFPRSFVLSHMT